MGESTGDVLLVEAMADYGFFSEHMLKIKPKVGQLVPFVMNEAQEFAHELIEQQFLETGKVRALLLKGRQQGMSTYVEGRYYWRQWRERGLNAFILTHEQDATDNLFSMVERYYENTPTKYRPAKGKGGSKELSFPEKDSSYAVGTARTKGTGRSQTIQLFHWSEVSHSMNQKEHAAGIMQGIPNAAGTEIILETTANGVGDLFYKMWKDAEAGRGDYIAIFIPWFWQKEYRVPIPQGFEWVLDEYEEFIKKENGLDDEQLYFRRLKISNFGGDEDLFKQEYPMNAEEAFIYSGKPFIPQETLQKQEMNLREPIMRGYLEQHGDEIRFCSMENGWLEIFETPKEKEDYVMGGDVAEGLEHGDLNSGHVLRRGLVCEQVARVSPMCEPDDFGRRMVLVAKFYTGRVPLGIERNSIGIAAVLAADKTKYKHMFLMPIQEGVLDERESTRLGWLTNSASRPILCNDLRAALRDGSLIVRSRETHAQLRTFVKGNGGKPAAAVGCWDDDVLGIGIAWQMVQRTSPIPHRSKVNPHGSGSFGGWEGM